MLARFRGLTIPTNALCALAALWVVLTANLSFWRLLLTQQVSAQEGWLFAASVAVALTGLHLFLFRILSPGRAVRVTLTTLLVIAAVAGWFMDTYGIAIDTAMLRNVVQTDVAEARDFLGWSLLWRLLWQAALPIVLLWSVRLPSVGFPRGLRDYALGSVAGLALLFSAALPMYSHYASFFRNHDVARYLIAPANVVVGSINAARKSWHRRQPFVQVGLDARRAMPLTHKPLLVLLVVGETARAASFSLGGYERDTNPRLEKQGVFYFRDASSCGTATAVSVPCMFSMLPRAEFDLAKADHRDTVLDVMQRAGVDVRWIDNQSGCKGVCARVPTRTAEQDDPGACSGGECLDETLIHSLAAELPKVQDDSLVVFHAMGSHGPAYHRRVPPDRAVFQPTCATERIETCTREQIINAYDNSIAYTDYVLSTLIDELRAREAEVDSVLLYVSDHGESLGEKGLYLHAQPYVIAPDVQKKVPLLMWFSSATADRLGLDTDCLRRTLAGPVSHDNVSHTLLGAMDVGTGVYRPPLDLLAVCRASGARAPAQSRATGAAPDGVQG